MDFSRQQKVNKHTIQVLKQNVEDLNFRQGDILHKQFHMVRELLG